MRTLKKIMFIGLALASVITFFTITVKAETSVQQVNTINEQDMNDSKDTLKKDVETSNLDIKEKDTKVEVKSQGEVQTNEDNSEENEVVEEMDPNEKVEVIQYPEEQAEEVLEEQAE